MLPSSNKDFFDFIESLIVNPNKIEEYRLYLTQLEPESFDSIIVGLLISDVKDELDSSTFTNVINAYNKRFYAGLDIDY